MKTKLMLLILILFAFWSGQAEARRSNNNFAIMSAVTVHAVPGTSVGGASIYIVDLRSPAYDPVTQGDFGLQFSGITCAYTSNGKTYFLSGATATVDVAGTNHLNIGVNGAAVSAGVLIDGLVIASKLEWTNVVSGLNVQSGNSEYGYGYDPEKLRYQVIRVTTGVTDITFTLYLDMD